MLMSESHIQYLLRTLYLLLLCKYNTCYSYILCAIASLYLILHCTADYMVRTNNSKF
jgi:hypothetical protein